MEQLKKRIVRDRMDKYEKELQSWNQIVETMLDRGFTPEEISKEPKE